MSALTKAEGPSPMALLQVAIDKGANPDQLGKLFDLIERHEKNLAAQAFADAVTKFQSKAPTVFKAREADVGGRYKYYFASYDDIMAAVGPILVECALCVTFSSEHVERGIKVACRVRHGIHVEEHTLTVPAPNMNVNDTQRYGAALSYAKRYALCAALNIVVTDEDPDAQGLEERITEEQAKSLMALVRKAGYSDKWFLEWAQVSRLSEMTQRKYKEAMSMIQNQPAKPAKAGAK